MITETKMKYSKGEIVPSLRTILVTSKQTKKARIPTSKLKIISGFIINSYLGIGTINSTTDPLHITSKPSADKYNLGYLLAMRSNVVII